MASLYKLGLVTCPFGKPVRAIRGSPDTALSPGGQDLTHRRLPLPRSSGSDRPVASIGIGKQMSDAVDVSSMVDCRRAMVTGSPDASSGFTEGVATLAWECRFVLGSMGSPGALDVGVALPDARKMMQEIGDLKMDLRRRRSAISNRGFLSATGELDQTYWGESARCEHPCCPQVHLEISTFGF